MTQLFHLSYYANISFTESLSLPDFEREVLYYQLIKTKKEEYELSEISNGFR